MLIRISLILAILAGLAVGVLNFVKVKEKITTLQTNLKTETEAHQKFEGQYNQTKRELDATNAVLKVTQETLKATEEQRDKAVAEAATQSKRAEQLTADLTRTKQDLDAAQSELAAYKATGMTPQQVATVATQIKNLHASLDTSETENKILMGKIRKLDNELAVYKPNPPPVSLPASINAKVLVSDPKWN